MLLIPPAIIGVAAVLLYLFEEAIRRGRPFDYLDVYGRGFATWWIDFQSFWGNLGLWTAFALFTGVFSACWLGKSRAPARALRLPLIGIGTILATGIVMATISATTGFMGAYDLAGILLYTWYPQYFPSRFLLVLFVFSGTWVLLLGGRRRAMRRGGGRITLVGAICLLAASAILIHATAVSSWDPISLVDVNALIIGVGGFLGFVLPLATFIVLQAGHPLGENQDSLGQSVERKGTDRRPVYLLAWMATVGASLLVTAIVIPLLFGADTGIVIKTETIAGNVMTWVHAAFVAAAIHLVACTSKEVSSS